MIEQTFEAVVDAEGNVRFTEALQLPQGMKVTVILHEEPEQVTRYKDLLHGVNPLTGNSRRMPTVRIRRNDETT